MPPRPPGSPGSPTPDHHPADPERSAVGVERDPAGAQEGVGLSPLLIDAWRAWMDQAPAMRATLRYFIEAFDEFDAFLDTLAGVDQLYFVGQGDSLFVGEAATFFVRYLEGCPCHAMSAYEFFTRPPPLSPSTLVFAISASGEVKATVRAARFARAHEAPVIGITLDAGSSLAHQVSFFLSPVLNVKSVIPLNATTTSIALVYMALLFILRGFLEDFPPALEERYEYVEDHLHRVPALIARLEDDVEAQMRQAAEAVAEALLQTNRRSLYYIGTGPGRACARIGATKVKELCYYHSEATELEEFAHYQKLLVGDRVPVFLVCPAKAEKRVAQFLRGLARIHADVYLLASENELPDLKKTRFPPGVHLVELPAVLEVFQPLVFVIPLQVFALYLTVALGQNPTTFRSEAHLRFVDI